LPIFCFESSITLFAFLSFLLWKNEIKIRFTETPFYFFETKNRSNETKNRKNLS
jgi:hypothetical protein